MTKSHPHLKRKTGPILVRDRFNTIRSTTQFNGESKTQASKGNETDVNAIMARFTRTGILPPVTEQPQYADVTDLQQDLQEILQTGKEAQTRLEFLQAEAQKRIKAQQQNETEPAPPEPEPEPSS